MGVGLVGLSDKGLFMILDGESYVGNGAAEGWFRPSVLGAEKAVHGELSLMLARYGSRGVSSRIMGMNRGTQRLRYGG